MTTKILFISILALIGFSFTAIDFLTPDLPPVPYNYANIPLPSDVVNNLTGMDNTPVSNPISDHGATLGRVLFYDVDLSQNHTISCSSCHIQKFSFTDTARFSKGFNGALTSRNSMGLIHARFQRDSLFFWDNRAPSLEAQALMPIVSPVEMGLRLDTLVARISAKPFYFTLFQNAFGTPAVTTDRIGKALAQFMRSMNTFGSKFRQGVDITNGPPESTPFANFTAQENLGKDLFMDVYRGNCQACHTRNVMVQQGAQNIGLDLVYADNGVGAASGRRAQDGKFSVPSLINIELTPPYMHDGRFRTLEQVIDFYSDSVKAHVNLSGFLRTIPPGTPNPNNNTCDTCPPRRPHFTPTEKTALVAFLKTLTDTVITTDVRWSNPFTCGTHNVSVISACDRYVWNGVTYSSSGTYIRSYINAGGCPSADTLHLTIQTSSHVVTRATACGSYEWNSATYTSSGTYVRNYTNASGCLSADTLYLTITPSSTLVSPTVTQTLVSNTCGARVFRYSSSVVSGASGYAWTIPSSVGGVSGVTLDSGDLGSSRIIRLKYTSNNAAVSGDSIRVRAYAACASSLLKSYKLTNTALNPPAAPTSITISSVQTQVCGSRIYRYSIPVLPSATSSTTAATGYIWTMPTGPVGSTGVLDSGNLSSRIIRIRYTSNAASGIQDSIRAQYNSACGVSVKRAVRLSNFLLLPPSAPSSITISQVADVCGARVYRYTAPALVAATSTSGAATGYAWTLSTGPVGLTGTLDSGSLSSRIIRVKYTSNAAATNTDSILVAYTSDCGTSARKAARLTNVQKNGCPPGFARWQPFETDIYNENWTAAIFPNPATDQFHIKVDEGGSSPISRKGHSGSTYTFMVYDALGRLRESGTLTPGAPYAVCGNLEPGVYYFTIRKGNQIRKWTAVKKG